RLQREASVESAVLTGTAPLFTHCVACVVCVRGVAHFSVLKTDHRCVPNQVWHLAAEIIGHCFDVDSCVVSCDCVSLTFANEANRRIANLDDVAQRRSVLLLDSV